MPFRYQQPNLDHLTTHKGAHWTRVAYLVWVISSATLFATGKADAEAEGSAKSISYRLSPVPNYGGALALPDGRLTDGVQAGNKMWLSGQAAGWTLAQSQQITIVLDLGEICSIRKLKINTVGGISQIYLPTAVLCFVSRDGENFTFTSDLVFDSTWENPGLLPSDSQNNKSGVSQAISSRMLSEKGRYVALVVIPHGRYFFADEIEVDAAPDVASEAITQTPDAPLTSFLNSDQFLTWAGLRRRLQCDLLTLQELDPQAVSPSGRSALKSRIETLSADAIPPDFQAAFPMHDIEKRLLALRIPSLRKSRAHDLLLSKIDRYQNYQPFSSPSSDSPDLTLSAFRDEMRSRALVATNSSSQPMNLTIHLEGPVPENSISIRKVTFVDTRERILRPAMLEPLELRNGGWNLILLPGESRELWVDIQPGRIAPGAHSFTLAFSDQNKVLAISTGRIHILDGYILNRTPLILGGWDYSNKDQIHGLTKNNKAEIIDLLKKAHVNNPWATSTAMPWGKFDTEGQMISEPSTQQMASWLALWPDALRYSIFLNIKPTIDGIEPGTPAFHRAVSGWNRFWTQYFERNNKDPDQIVVHLLDEPKNEKQLKLLKLYSGALKASGSRFKIYCNPSVALLSEENMRYLTDCDIICLHRPQLPSSDIEKRKFLAGLRDRNFEIELYSCEGPSDSFDPTGYFRLQAWDVFALNGNGEGFWGFSGSRVNYSINPYLNIESLAYEPFLLTENSAVATKHMEAIREGAQDYQYLRALKRLETEGNMPAGFRKTLARLEGLLRDVHGRISEFNSQSDLKWMAEKPSAPLDETIATIGEFIARLSGFENESQ